MVIILEPDVNKFQTLLKQPAHASADTLRYLKDIVRQYPWFESAHYLLLRALKTLNPEELSSRLPRAALVASSRTSLYDWLNKPSSVIDSDQTEVAKEEDEKIPAEYPADGKPVNEPEPPRQETSVVENDSQLPGQEKVERKGNDTFIGWLQKLKKNTQQPAETPLFEQAPVYEIEFRKTAVEAVSRKTPEQPVPQAPDAGPGEVEEEDIQRVKTRAVESITEHDDMVSETLAMILEAQKKYDKAIRIYEKLQLKNPDKSGYFADKIKALQNKR